MRESKGHCEAAGGFRGENRTDVFERSPFKPPKSLFDGLRKEKREKKKKPLFGCEKPRKIKNFLDFYLRMIFFSFFLISVNGEVSLSLSLMFPSYRASESLV